MKGKYLRRIGGWFLAMLLFSGIVFVSPSAVEAQSQGSVQAQGRRVVRVQRYPRRIYRPWGFRHRWHSPFYDPWGYDPWSPYGGRYRQYVFSNSEKAVEQGYKDGFKTGKSDGKKDKSYDPQRSHYYSESGFGNFAEIYRSGFSQGYQQGYREGRNSRAS